MTQILVDQFQGSLYVFADGRATSDTRLITDSDMKISHVISPSGLEIIWSFAGSVGGDLWFKRFLTEESEDKIISNLLEDTKECGVSGFLIFKTSKNEVMLFDIMSDSITKEKGAWQRHLPLSEPISAGCGGPMLEIAYLATKTPKAKTEDKYLLKVAKAFELVASKELSCNGLTSVAKLDLSTGEVVSTVKVVTYE